MISQIMPLVNCKVYSVDPHDFYDYDDEFDYFQYYGSQAEGEGKWMKQIKEDEDRFKATQKENEGLDFQKNVLVQRQGPNRLV